MTASGRRAGKAGVRLAVAVAAGAALASGLLQPSPATAGDDTGEAVDGVVGTIALVDQPPWVELGGATELVVAVNGATPDTEIAVTVHQATTSGTGFAETLFGDNLGSTLGQISIPPADLEAEGGGLRIPVLLDPALPSTISFPAVSLPGVYPVVVELRDPTTGLVGDGFITYLVVADTTAAGAVAEQLRVAWIWQLVADPTFNADGAPDERVVSEFRSDGRLGRIATRVPDRTDVAVTLAPSPETVESWATLATADEDSDGSGATLAGAPSGGNGSSTTTTTPAAITPGLDAMLEAVRGGQQLLSGPFVPVDAPSLVSAGMAPQLDQELIAGAFSLGSTFSVGVDPETAVAVPVDDAAVSALTGTAIERLVVESDDLTPVEEPLTPAAPFLLDADGTVASAAMANNAIRDLLEGDSPPALKAQRFLAALSSVAFEQPGVARGIVLLSPQRWNPDAATLEAALAGLTAHPLLETTSIDGYFDALPVDTWDEEDEPVVRHLEGYDPPPPNVTTSELGAATSDLRGLSSLVDDDDPRISAGGRNILVSLTSLWSGGEGRARAREELDVIHATAAEVTSLVTAASDQTVTITARRADIPVTFRNNADEPIEVLVHFESEKLLFPEGDDFLVELPPRSSTKRFEVEARTSGTFPLVMTVTSPDGRLEFQSSRLTVRSTAFTGVGLVITIAAASFLALWWGTHWIRSRRRKRAGAA
ncbi:MAG: DUF6049 family protein [Acidimicrobiia bacterium]